MALAVRQTKTSTRAGGANSASNAFTSSILAGSLLIAHTAMFNSGGTGESVISDGTNGTWGSAASTGYFENGDADSEIQLNAFPNSGAASITVTSNPPGTSADIDLSLMEVTGAETSSARDVSVTNTSTFTPSSGPTTVSVVSGTLAQANEILVSSFSHTSSTIVLSGDTGDSFTQLDENENNSTGQTFHAQYKIVSATTSVTVNGTIADHTDDGTRTWFTGVASYKEASGGTLYTTTVAGAFTPAGLVVKRVNKVLTGTVTLTGLVVKQIKKLLSGSVTPVGLVVKRVNKVLSGVLTVSGTLDVALRYAVSLAGTLTPVGSLVKQANKVLSGALTPIGSLVKQVNKALSAALSLVGSISSVFISGGGALYEVTVNGALAISGTIVKQVNKIVSGVVTPVADIVNAARFSVILEGVLTVTGNLVQQANKVLTGSVTVSGVLVKTVNKVLSSVITPTGQLVKTIVKVIEGAINAVGTVTVNYIQQVTVSGTLTAVGTLVSDFINGSGVVLKSMLPWVRRRDRGRGK